jgi:DNA-binding CsgD family transcriptional regulator
VTAGPELGTVAGAGRFDGCDNGAVADPVESGRKAFARGAWSEARAHLGSVEDLDQDDLERLAVAAHLVGDRRACELAWERAHRLAAARGDHDRAARCAFWLGFDLLLRGEEVRANGWLARAERIAADVPDGSAAGFLLLPAFLGTLGGSDARAALEVAMRIGRRGREASDSDLVAFGLLCEGEALIVLGELAEGMRRLDEVMVSITTGEVSPIPTGIIYCAVIDACMHARDLRRAAVWTEALSAWCGSDASLVPYRGQCLVHRSQILLARGAWQAAGEEAERARAHLAHPEHPALGFALYQLGELHRLRGELGQAEHAYRAASQHGFEPAPGLGLLRLAQGRIAPAVASARRMLHEQRTDPDRSTQLAAVVEILVAAGALDEAALACNELDELAASAGAEMLAALASTARAALLLASGEASAAAPLARTAIAEWRRLEMPYEEARAHALMAGACAALDDRDAAELERGAAVAAFERLGARAALTGLAGPLGAAPLSRRECEVIRLVATGRTNRDIAGALSISEHTVARHVQNILVKLGLPSRAAATAYAYEHGLV